MKKKFRMILTAIVMSFLMALIQPVQMIGVAAASAPLYVSEVKVGMGEDEDEAAAELLAEGYTILRDADGSYADLNYKAGTRSGMKAGPTQRVVLLGYKTTTNPKEAITDLAVMNMYGGYSPEDYNKLMSDHMDGEIKPFVERFIAALNEYRDNYNKPADSLVHKRADFYRKMLNKLTDDDTGGKPLGDLLLNQTKYEMGDDAYNALSAEEKNNHCDILTLLMQGNGRGVLLLETLITKATDSAENTWIDRFLDLTAEELRAQVKAECPWLTTEADIIAEMDKRYNDTAKKILEKWSVFNEAIIEKDDTINEIINADLTVADDLEERLEKLDEVGLTEETAKSVIENVQNESNAVTTMIKGEEAVVLDYLESTEYNRGSLLEFFDREVSELSGENIRELYPIAAALSPGQIAGLDFLSITDMFSMAIITEEGFDSLKIDEMEPASIFQDVDREIYEPGGVAITDKALRNKKNELDDDSDFMLSRLGIVFWGLTAVSGIATITTVILNQYFLSQIPKIWQEANDAINYAYQCMDLMTHNAYFNDAYAVGVWTVRFHENVDIAAKAPIEAAKYASKAHFTYYLGIGLTVLTAILAGISI